MEISPSTGRITISKNATLSLDDVRALEEGGHEVSYTPHIGNKWREDMFLTRAGIRQVLVSRNAAFVDDIDRPHQVRVGGRNLRFVSSAQHGTLSPFLIGDGEDVAEIRSRFPRYAPLEPAATHVASVKDAVPGNYVIGDRLLFLEDETSAKIRAILEVVACDPSQDVLSRQVVDGRITQRKGVRGPREFQRCMDFIERTVRNVELNQTTPAEGPIPSNAFAIMSLALRSALRRAEGAATTAEHDEVFTVSGSSMINYVKQIHGEMEKIYAVSRRVFPRLPETLTYHFVPGANFDFVPVESEVETKGLIERLIELDCRMREMSRAIGKAQPERKAGLIAERRQVGEERNAVRAQMLVARAKLPFLSHYDVLGGQQISEPAGLSSLPLSDVRLLFHP